MSEDLTERAATFGLILDDVSLVRVLPFRFFPLECAQIRAVEKRLSGWPEKGELEVWTCGLCLSAVTWYVVVTAPVSTSGFVAGLL